METLLPLLESLGGPGSVVAAVFGWLYWQERSERMAKDATLLDTLRSVLPAIEILDRAARRLEGDK